MLMKTFTAKSMPEVLALVKQTYGSNGVILHTRSYKKGGLLGMGGRQVVEVTATDGRQLAKKYQRKPDPSARQRAMQARSPLSEVLAPTRSQPPAANEPSAGDLIRKTGDGEYALTGLTDDNSRHYQLIPQTRAEPGIRRWRSPYGRVLAVSRRIGQFDLTEEEIHRRYTKPRLLGHAETMGIGIVLSDRSDNGMITLALA